jgi:hypothetical protein
MLTRDGCIWKLKSAGGFNTKQGTPRWSGYVTLKRGSAAKAKISLERFLPDTRSELDDMLQARIWRS